MLNLLHHWAFKSFIAECEALRNIRHQNLVKVLIICSGVDYQGHDFKALVYEFMTNGNLDEWLHPISRTNEVTKEQMNLHLQRLNIAIDVAKHWNIFIFIVIHQLLIATSSLAMFFSMMKWLEMLVILFGKVPSWGHPRVSCQSIMLYRIKRNNWLCSSKWVSFLFLNIKFFSFLMFLDVLSSMK